MPIPTGSPSIWACCVVQKGLPPTSRTDHQPPLSLLNSLCSAPQCLPERWLAQEEVAWDGSSPVHGPQDHRGKDHLTLSFPSLRKKAHTHLRLISLPRQYSSAKTSDSFSGVFGFFFQNCLHVLHQDSVLLRGGIYCCMHKSNGKGRQCSDLLRPNTLLCDPQMGSRLHPRQSSPAKPALICIHFSCTNMV